MFPYMYNDVSAYIGLYPLHQLWIEPNQTKSTQVTEVNLSYKIINKFRKEQPHFSRSWK